MKLNSYSVNSEFCFILILMHDRLDAIIYKAKIYIDSMDSLASHMFFICVQLEAPRGWGRIVYSVHCVLLVV